MYTGTVINELFATVERAEAKSQKSSDIAELENWYAASHHEAAYTEPDLLGVA